MSIDEGLVKEAQLKILDGLTLLVVFVIKLLDYAPALEMGLSGEGFGVLIASLECLIVGPQR